MASHEMIYVFSKAGSYYERIDITGNFPKGGGGRSCANFMNIAELPNTGSTKEGIRCVKSVIEIANKKQKGQHPTMKPVEIYEWLIKRYSKEGDTVLDPTFGSGNSVITAYNLDRCAIGIEMNKEFYDKACARI
jgi:site-specific DNA-methyltransferase (adenine-specific)